MRRPLTFSSTSGTRLSRKAWSLIEPRQRSRPRRFPSSWGGGSPSDERDRVPLLLPARVAADLDPARLDARRQLGQVCGDGALGHGRRDEHAADALAPGVRQARHDRRLQPVQERLNYMWSGQSATQSRVLTPNLPSRGYGPRGKLGRGRSEGKELGRTQPRHAGQDVHVAVGDDDGHPEVLAREDELLLQRARVVRGKLDHAQLRLLRRRVLVPVEPGLRRVWLGEALHALVGLLIQLDFEAESLGDGLVGYVVVPGLRLSIQDSRSWIMASEGGREGLPYVGPIPPLQRSDVSV